MKRKYIWLIEIIVWTLIVLGSLFFFIYKTKIESETQNMYYIFVNDAGGLINGSPVRLMGINIGYIKDVKIFDNKVFVSFIVNKKGVKLPKKTSAIIEFYGLGGSTSLELMQDDTIISQDRDVILPVNSYRVKDLWDGQTLVANVLIDIYGGIGRTIKSADLLNKKEYLKQSALVKDFSSKTGEINTFQTVIIEKLTKDTKFRLENNGIMKKDKEKTNE